jgi:hypothetical protein
MHFASKVLIDPSSRDHPAATKLQRTLFTNKCFNLFKFNNITTEKYYC